MRRAIEYPGGRVGPETMEYINTPLFFFEGWDKFVEQLSHVKDPATLFMVTKLTHSMMDSEIGFRMHAGVMVEELISPNFQDEFADYIEKWIPKKEEETVSTSHRLRVDEEIEEVCGGGVPHEGDSIDDGEFIWTMERGQWVPTWRKERSNLP